MRALSVLAGVAVMVGAVKLPAQTPPRGAAAEATITRWLLLVSGGAADEAWNEAGPLFQNRITELGWRDWVRAHADLLRAGGTRRETEFAVGQDEPPLAPLHWVRATYARDRPGGGRIFEQIIVLEEDGHWRVAHYGAWTDAAAVVSNASLAPVPYFLGYRGQYTFTEFPWRVISARPRARVDPPAAERPRNVANPTTFPRRPPPTR